MKNICITNSYYVLLIYLLIIDNFEDTIYILGKNINLKNTKNIIKILEYPHCKFNNIINYFYFFIKFKLKKDNITVYGQDHLFGCSFFKDYFAFKIIEDGLSFYDYIPVLKKKLNDENKVKKILKKILKSYPHHGLDIKTKTIYMSEMKEIPKEFKQKEIIKFDIKKMWENKTQIQKDKILTFLEINREEFRKIKELNSLLITQPLSEDGYITEKEKVQIYKKICNGNKNIIIKPHPREKTEYKKYFKEALILGNNFPIEFILLLDIEVSQVLTLFSTAAFSLKKYYDIEFYGTYNVEKLEKNFGIIKHEKINKKRIC